MQTENTAQPTLRTYVKLAGLYLMAIGLLFNGWNTWTEGSALIRPKNADAYVAMRGRANEGSFYTYVVSNLAVGALLLLAGFLVTWAVFFSRNSATKAKVLECVNTPLIRGPRIPTWFSWGRSCSSSACWFLRLLPCTDAVRKLRAVVLAAGWVDRKSALPVICVTYLIQIAWGHRCARSTHTPMFSSLD